MAELINASDPLNQGRIKLNKSIEQSERAEGKSEEAKKIAEIKGNGALTTSEEAKTISKQARETSRRIEAQLDVITGSNTIDPAVEQMKVDILGVVHPSPDARLRADYEKTNTQLTHYATPEQFWKPPMVDTNDTEIIDMAIKSLDSKGGTLIFNPKKKYKMSRSLIIPHNVSFDGSLTSIIPIEGGAFIDGFMFFINANLDKSQIQPFGGEIIAQIKRIRFNNENGLVGIKAFYTKSKTNFSDITFNNMYKGFLKEGSVDHDYTDMISFENMYFINSEGNEPLLDIRYNGDGLFIKNCHTAGASSKNYNFLNLEFCNGAKIEGQINGDITIKRSTGIDVESFHCEHGKLQIEASSVRLGSIYHWYHEEFQPIPLTIKNFASDKKALPCIIENYYIIHKQNRNGMTKEYAKDNIDAYFENANVKIINLMRLSQMESDQSLGMATAAKVSFDGTIISSEWEKASQLYAKESYIIDTKINTPIIETVCPNNFSLYSIGLSDHAKFDEVPKNYYYRAVFYFGYSDRKIGRYGGEERSINLTNQNKIPLLNLQYRTESQYSKVRLYRGAEPGKYSHYVDIPVGSGFSIYDYGYFVSTGEHWVSRNPEGVDSYNNGFTKVKNEGENIVGYNTGIPTFGYWKKGDKVIEITNNSYKEYICTISGDFSDIAPLFVTK